MPCPDPTIYPLTFTPALRPYVWGGRNLETVLGRELPPGIIAESWEISGHGAASTRVESGHWAGTSLADLLPELGERLVGVNAAGMLKRAKFPLLVKILDAQRNLSVQVHPDNAYALAHEDGDLGKVECWYVLHAEPGAGLVYGLKAGVTREAFEQAVANDTLGDLLHTVAIAPGDVAFLPAGTVHALMAGAMVIEIQQNSDSTYRVYDWDRLGVDGKPRSLHIAKALDVIDWGAVEPDLMTPRLLSSTNGCTAWELVRCPQFVVEKVALEAGATFKGACTGATFEIWGCVEGEVDVCWAGEPLTLRRIRFTLLPAALGAFEIRAASASVLLRAWAPPGN